MATIKISELEELNKSNDENLLVIVDSVENATKKIKVKNLGVGGSSVPAGDTLPVGSIVPYGNKEAPTNWLSCNGQAVSRTTYADLFTIIGTQFGSGDGSTTFNLPDLNQYRVPIGYDRTEEQSNRMNLGTVGGEEKHTMTINELVAHNHIAEFQGNYGQDGSFYGVATNSGADGENVKTKKTGGGQPFNVMQPYVTTNYIIKAFQSAGVLANVAQTKTNSDTDTYSCNYLNEVTVWENANITQPFLSQNINIDLRTYKKIKIYSYRYKTVDERQVITEFDVGTIGEIIYSDYDGKVRTWNRRVGIYKTVISFDNCNINGEATNGGLVPSKIVAYKYI